MITISEFIGAAVAYLATEEMLEDDRATEGGWKAALLRKGILQKGLVHLLREDKVGLL